MTDAPTLRFAAPVYPGGRHCLLCGSATVGAIFPPVGLGGEWVWRVWVTADRTTRDGRTKSEATAKAKCRAAFKDFLATAQLQIIGVDHG